MGERAAIPLTRQQALRARLVCQGLGAKRIRAAGSAAHTVEGLLSVPQKHAAHAIGLRSRATRRDVDEALRRAELVAVHVLGLQRRLVSAGDVRWLQELTSPHVERTLTGELAALGLTSRVIGTSLYAIADLLSDSHRMTATDMAPHLAAHGLPHDGRAYRTLLGLASLRGLVCFVDGGYLLTDDIVPPQRHLDPDEALARLARRFYEGHGPSSLGDLARWSSLPLSLAARATAAAAADLITYDVDGLEHHGPRLLLPLNGDVTHRLTLNDEAVHPYPDLPFLAGTPAPEGVDGLILHGVHVTGYFRFDEAPSAGPGVVSEAASEPAGLRPRS